ncbi:MAG: hypothetical protein PVS2B3_08620 [Steroidobacteraceae bacterium]
MDIGVEISLYPLTADYAPHIRDFVARFNADARFRVQTNSMSTQVFGGFEPLMDALRQQLRTTFAAMSTGTQRAVFVMKVYGPLPPA